MKKSNRRDFLRMTSVSGLGVAAPWAVNLASMSGAAAQSAASDYKALVCVFLYGGNDAFNTVLATDSTSWAHYVRTRDPRVMDPNSAGSSIALSASELQEIPNRNLRGQNTGRQFALHPKLGQLRKLYYGNRLAVVANVGTLIRPTTAAQYLDNAHPKPPKLFSHNDQQSIWQSFSPEGATAGWGGRLSDVMMSNNANPMFSSLAVNSTAVWLSGRNSLQFQVGSSGIYQMGGTGAVPFLSAGVYSAMQNVVKSNTRGDVLGSDHAMTSQRALQAEATLLAAVPGMGDGPWGTAGVTSQGSDPKLQYVLPNGTQQAFNPLAAQLQMVARMIAARNAAGVGAKRQIFFVGLSGFDTHSDHISKHADLMAQLDHGLAYFDTVLGAMPGGSLRSQVTTFTASDFGRSMTNNDGGSDHGWGGHHFVMGGAVQGGDVYGRFPTYSSPDATGKFNSPDQVTNGVLLPEISVDQYAYTLGRWFGVSDSDLANIMPNALNFPVQNLGFMG